VAINDGLRAIGTGNEATMARSEIDRLAMML
jgi:hypothetical protein